MPITVKRPISVMAVVTEQFKQELVQELQEAAESAQHTIEQIEFRARGYLADLQRADLTRAMAARQQIEAEKRKHEAVRKEFLDRITEVSTLELGSEYPRGTLEGLVDLSVGDDLFGKLGQTQILIKDGVIQEIREPSAPGV